MSENTTKKKSIVFTGGGSAGHVVPNIVLIKQCQEQGWSIAYVGSKKGIERNLIGKLLIPYYAVACGKLRRYFSWHNFVDPFKLLYGIMQSFFILRKLQPAVVFSKGGFVAVPVVVAAWLRRIPVVAHEDNLTPGLANKISYGFCSEVCIAFSESKHYFKGQEKITVTGNPLRGSLFSGDAERGKAYCGFSRDKPVLLVMGGGLGSANINQTLSALLPELTQDYNIIHLSGKDKIDPKFAHLVGYKQFEYVDEEMGDIFACADFVVSRSGANAAYEVLALRKPHIFIPLSAKTSRGDQIHNAQFFAGKGLSLVIDDASLTPQTLLQTLGTLTQQQQDFRDKMNAYNLVSGTQAVYQVIEKHSGNTSI